jgi:hypothetical protein
MIINVHGCSRKIPVILVKFSLNLDFLDRVFENYSNVKFRENPSSGSRVVPCGQADMMNPIVAFRNFANAPSNAQSPLSYCPFQCRNLSFHADATQTSSARCHVTPSSSTLHCTFPRQPYTRILVATLSKSKPFGLPATGQRGLHLNTTEGRK